MSRLKGRANPPCQPPKNGTESAPIWLTDERGLPTSFSVINSRILSRSELPTDTRQLARYLIGKTLVHDTPQGRMAGRIVETEAYLVGDAAAHSFRGLTPRNKSLFMERGHAYVYFIYGNWFCLNVSGDVEGVGAGVLLRALEPAEGIDLMLARRTGAKLSKLASGPGCLATALGVDRSLDGVDLCGGSPLWLGSPLKGGKKVAIGNSVRIGLTKEAHRLLRYYERGNESVSGSLRLRS
jgi:DNA-3-methyladenine glycosylase